MNLITGNAITGFVTAIATGPEDVFLAFVMIVVELTALIIFIAATANFTSEVKRSLASLGFVAGIYSVSSLLHFIREFFLLPYLEIWENLFVIFSVVAFVLSVNYLRKIVLAHYFGEAEK
ncbi:MAG: hypothetical protein V1839_00055 [archaeon]